MRMITILLSISLLAGCSKKVALDGPLGLIAEQNTVSITWTAQSPIKQDFPFVIQPNSSGLGLTYTKISGPAWATVDSNTGAISGVAKGTSSVVRIAAQGSGKQGVFDVSISAIGDPLKAEQWHLENLGQSSFSQNSGSSGSDLSLGNLAAQGIIGTGVKIAVSDSGIQIAQPDLSQNLLSSEHRDYNISYYPFLGNPTPELTNPNNTHGTAVSGIIAAKGWNGIGGRGVAPNASVAGFKYLGTPGTSDSIRRNDQASGNFDIFNYSYGTSQFSYVPPILDFMETLRAGISSGRNGLGNIYVKSAGNSYLKLLSNIDPNYPNSYYLGNSNFDGANTSPYTIIVGANNANDRSASYSSPGSNIWVSAPGGEDGTTNPAIVTTDFTGCLNGYSRSASTKNNFEKGLNPLNSNCDYTSTMNGTSSAAPNVSGVIALMLQANPNLSWRDVKHILAQTSRKIDPNLPSTGHPLSANLPGHTYQESWITNSAGFHFHNWYGFGAINADAAVNLAQAYTSNIGTLSSTDSNISNWMYTSGGLNLPIPDYSAGGTSSQIIVNHNYAIEAIQIKLNISHPNAGEIGVELTSPAGTKSQLLNINSFIYASNLTETVLLTNAFYGEQSHGAWTLKVIDGSPGNAGAILNWSIRIYGHASAQLGDTTPPTAVASVNHAGSYNSQTQSPLISWSPSSSNDVIRYEYSIGATPGSTSIKPWTSVGLSTSVTATDLNLVLNSQYFVNIRAFDSSENVSPVTSSSGWYYTNAGSPVISIGAPSVTAMNSGGTVQYLVSFSGANSVAMDPSYISLNATGGVNCAINVTGSGLSSRMVQLSACTGNGTVQFSVNAGAVSNQYNVPSLTTGPSTSVTIDNNAPSISGLTSYPSAAQSRSWAWTCTENPCQYRYIIDQTPSTAPQGPYGLTSSAAISGQTGTFYLHVQAKDVAGNESQVSHVSAVLDNTAPSITGLSNDAIWKKTKTWSWGCDKPSCTYRTLIDTNPTTSPTSTFSANATTTQAYGTGTYYLHIQAQDGIGNLSSIQHYSVLLDNTAPSAPTVSLSATGSSSLSETPIITLGGGNDANSGFQKYQIRIKKVGSAIYILPWTDHVSGGSVVGLSLLTNSSYSVEVQSIDNVGNPSSFVSTSWLVDNTPPSAPSSIAVGPKPRDLAESTTVSWSGCTEQLGGVGGVTSSVQLLKVADQSIIATSSTLQPGNKFTGLTLDDNTEYQFTISCSDNLGNSVTASSPSFTTNSIKFIKACAGPTVSCGINSSGGLKCWGNPFTQIPTTIAGYESGVTDVACNDDKVLVVKSGQVSSLTGDTIPTGLPSDNQRIFYSYGYNGNIYSLDACSVTSSGDVWCWGTIIYASAQCAYCFNSATFAPTLMTSISNPKKITIGTHNRCATFQNGPSTEVKCWGAQNSFDYQNYANFNPDSQYQYTNGYTSWLAKWSVNPSTVPSGIEVASFGNGTCVLYPSGVTYGIDCWGLPKPGTPYFTNEGNTPIDLTMNQSGNKCVLYSNNRIKCGTAYNGGPVSFLPDCDESPDKLLSTSFFLSSNGFIRGVGTCSNVSN